eukprot:364297-Chlamydomonas_euryale.AAC.3
MFAFPDCINQPSPLRRWKPHALQTDQSCSPRRARHGSPEEGKEPDVLAVHVTSAPGASHTQGPAR